MNALRFVLFVVLCSGSLPGQQPGVDFQKGSVRIQPDPQTATLSGEVRYIFRYTGDSDSVRIDARQMDLIAVELDGKPAKFDYDGARIAMAGLRKKGQHHLLIRYRCAPEAAMYFIGWGDSIPDNEQIWTQGQGKYSSHWVPSFDDMREKVVFDLHIRFQKAFTVAANGRMTGVKREGPYTTWSYSMSRPMSSYLLAFAIGRYEKMEFSSRSGVPNKLFYPAGALDEARQTYAHSREIFDFLEAEIGWPYPWQVYQQVPVDDFLYAGMENTTLTLFSSDFLVDSLGYQDRSYENVNAHELAHQWFGNLVTEADGASHWLHEGFASFYAYLAEAEVSGREGMYWKLYDTALRLDALDEEGQGTALLDPGSGSLIFYEKGAWALFALQDEVGRPDFRKGIRKYLQAHAYGNATVADFLSHMEEASGHSLEVFRNTWLESTDFPLEKALAYLQPRSPSLAYFRGHRELSKNPGSFSEAWNAFAIGPYRAALIDRWAPRMTPEDYALAFGENEPAVLKAALRALPAWQDWMLPLLEPLLDGPSYEIREAALYRLWVAVPESRRDYLERTEANGSKDAPTFRQLWWMLSVFTDDFRTPEARKEFLEQLRATTAPGYPRRVRRNGFNLLSEIQALSDRNIRDLVEATEHHSWQFRLFARRMLDQLIEVRPDARFWRALSRSFPEGAFPYFNQKIGAL